MKSWLPTIPHTLTSSPESLKYLIIAPPKWGKTTLFSTCPNCLLMAFESGYGFVECPKIVVNSWKKKGKEQGVDEDDSGLIFASAYQVIEELEKENPYSLIIIDTIDEAIKMCQTYNCERAGVEHPSEGGDYGRGWSKLVIEPFRNFYGRLSRLGVGLVAITHSKEQTDKDKFGKDRFRRATSLSDSISQFVVAQSDVIMHGFLARRRKNKKDRDRYVSFDGTDEILAGSRISKIYIPNKYILAGPGAGWAQWKSFFTNSPEAGKKAEEDFHRLYTGIDDENIEYPVETTYAKAQEVNITRTSTNRETRPKVIK